MSKMAYCWQSDCFAYRDGQCDCLTERVGHKCSFYKTDGEVTNGKRYPYVPRTKTHETQSYKTTREEIEADIERYNQDFGDTW